MFGTAILVTLMPASLAGAQVIVPPAHAAQAQREGCSVQRVHVPAGKIMHDRPVVRCAFRDVTLPADARAVSVKGDTAAVASPAR